MADDVPADEGQVEPELVDELIAAMQRVPELAGRELTLSALSGGITNRNFLVDAAGPGGALRDPDGRATTRTCSASVARPSTRPPRRPRRRGRGTGGRRVHPPGGLPGHPLHHRQPGQPGAGPPARHAAARGRLHSAASTAGRPSPASSCRCASWRPIGRWPPIAGVPIPPAYERLARGRPAHRAGAARQRRSIPLPCHNDLLNANFIDDGERIRIVDWEYAGMGDPFFDLGNFSVNHELHRRPMRPCCAAYEGAGAARPAGTPQPDAGRVRLPRGDVGRAAAGHQHPGRRLRGLRGRALRAPAGQRVRPGLRARAAGGGGWLRRGLPDRARVRDHRRRRGRRGGRLPPDPPGLDRCRPARALRADQRLHLPLGRPGGPAARQPDPDPDDGRQRRHLPAAWRPRPGWIPGWREVGSLRLASSPERMEELRRQAGWAKAYGLADGADRSIRGAGPIPPDVDRWRAGRRLAAHRRLPRPDRPDHGPGGRRAQRRGPDRRADPRDGDRRGGGSGRAASRPTAVGCEAEVVVNAAGMFAPEIGRMAGVTVPVIPFAHQYLVTEAIDGVDAGPAAAARPGQPRLLPAGGARPGDGRLRAQPGHLRRWTASPPTSTASCCPRLAALRGDQRRGGPARAGHGRCRRPAADQRPGGLHPGQRVHPGRVGGARLLRGGRLQRPRHRRRRRAGPPGGALDRGRRAARSTCGRWTSAASARSTARRSYTLARSFENYATYYDIHYPNEERQAGRPLRLSPTYPRLVELDCAFGEKSGWERPNWFESNAAAGDEALRPRGWAGRHWSPAIGAEALATATGGRPLRRDQLRQDRDRRARRARLPAAPVRQRHGPAGRPHHLHPDAQPARRHRVRLHRHAPGGGSLLDRHRHRLRQPRPGLDPRATRPTTAASRCATSPPPAPAWASGARRHARSSAALTDDDLSNDAFPYLTARQITVGQRAGAGAAGHLRRRAGLGAVLPDRVRPALWDALWQAGASARPAWPGAIGPSTACGWRRATGSGRPTSPRRTRRTRPAWASRCA